MGIGLQVSRSWLRWLGTRVYFFGCFCKQLGKTGDSVGGNSYIVGFIFFIFPFALTQFMLNRATMLIFHPIAIATAASLGADPRGLMILVQAACLTAFMTPMANGTVPFIMGYGGYTQKSLLKQGLPIAIVICLVSVLWTMTVFPLFP